MDRTVAARMRRYRVRLAFKAVVQRAYRAGLTAEELLVLMNVGGDRVGRADVRTVDMFDRNGDRRYGQVGEGA